MSLRQVRTSWRLRLKGLMLIGLLSLVTGLRASTGAEFLRPESSPNATVMMGGSALEGGSAMLAINPAGLLGQAYASLAFTHYASFVETAYEQMEFLWPAQPGLAWAGRLFYDSTYNFVAINDLGERVATVDNYDLLLNPAVAWRLDPMLDLGVGLKLFRSVIASYSSMGAAADIGVQVHWPGMPLSLGASLQNLGMMTAYDQQADSLPLALTLGGAWDVNFGINQLILTADLTTGFDEHRPLTPIAGMEYHYASLASVRLAYRMDEELGNIIVGAGVQWRRLGLDYSYQPYGVLGENHRLTLSYYFRSLAQEKPHSSAEAVLAEETPQLKAQSLTKQKVAVLTELPRTYNAKLTFMPLLKRGPFKPWNLTITNDQQQTIRQFYGDERLPQRISWDGMNNQGQPLLQSQTCTITLDVDGKTRARQEMPIMAPAVRLMLPQDVALPVPVIFQMSRPLATRGWTLQVMTPSAAPTGTNIIMKGTPSAAPTGTNIIMKGTPSAASFSGQGAWKDPVTWVSTVNDTHLSYELELVTDQPIKVILKEPIKTVTASTIMAPEGYEGLKISGVLFDFNQAALKPEMADKLQAVSQLLAYYPQDLYVICEGHADEVGDQAYNQTLSEKRAQMVAEKLVRDSGVSQDRVSIKGYGQARPENSLGTPEGMARNRRVDIKVFFPVNLAKKTGK